MYRISFVKDSHEFVFDFESKNDLFTFFIVLCGRDDITDIDVSVLRGEKK